ncbi:hypothetical protein D9601_03245 [Sphingomonas sp. MA1305]|uniref:hypothetical protein n=1 Tax=Sphingomonas sp. MA1305 TaxID=2479204 RepID=UPI0018E00885|nr:hypothetical protein [Sphingomonas sp. MA1305]MBI0474380.1 hypothetical protein [Sphingomonas sp. MA1305]
MHRRALTPIWLARPSRFAEVQPRGGRIGAALLALLLVLATLLVYASPAPPVASGRPENRADDRADVVLYETIVANVRAGRDYYLAAADAQRAGGYPLRPFVTVRLPTLARVQAALPPLATPILLYLLCAAVAAAWGFRLRTAFARTPPRVIALALLAGGLMVFVQPDLAAFHEIWAGLFVALSLGLWRPDRWLPSVAFGLAAVLIRETAGLYLAIMAGCALVEGRRRETAGWLVAIAILAAVLVLHAHAVAQVVRPLDPASPGWSDRLGIGLFIRALVALTALDLAPLWLAAPLVGLSLFGWAAWRDLLAMRVLATMLAYAMLLGLFARPDTFYWAMLIAPLSLVGLAFALDGGRDLLAAAFDTRRITVTRVVR